MEKKIVTESSEFQAMVAALSEELLDSPESIRAIAKRVCEAVGLPVTVKPETPQWIRNVVQDKGLQKRDAGWHFVGNISGWIHSTMLRELADWLEVADSDVRVSAEWEGIQGVFK